MQDEQIKLFTLIHVADQEISIHNNFVTSMEAQIRLYLLCAKQLAESLEEIGVVLTVITNNSTYLKTLVPDYTYPVVQLSFSSHVPTGIRFFSAHYKFEVIHYLGSVADGYIGLVDSDIVCINAIPSGFKEAIEKKTWLYYDITEQVVPNMGSEVIISAKERLLGAKASALWAGGEFLAGPPAFFSDLDMEIGRLKDAYFADFRAYPHQGDEMVLSAAIERLKLRLEIEDAGKLGVIGRFWSVSPLHQQQPVEAFADRFMLHLPSDKPFIAKSNIRRQNRFLKRYKVYLIRKKLFRALFSPLIPYAKSLLKWSAKNKFS